MNEEKYWDKRLIKYEIGITIGLVFYLCACLMLLYSNDCKITSMRRENADYDWSKQVIVEQEHLVKEVSKL